ncbi:MAG: sulfatase-like hydrolase/transferase [Verrucomicrobia bacterium]|nr:sulfatase-like hydrolase/transferase [Verrucomicrobiota bacterium]
MKFIPLVLCSVLSVFTLSASESAQRKPNILYIFTDDQSVRSVSSYPQAHPWVKTPNIDRLAKDGVRFASSYTGAKCTPSRGSALTGQLQFNYSKETPYWTSALREHGYYTGMVGKWHWNVPRHGDAWDWSVVWEHHLGDAVAGGYYTNQFVSVNGAKRIPLGGYSTDRYTDYTVQFLKERAKEKDRPWYFWVCYGAVHGPYIPADRHLKDYEDAPPTKIPVDVFGPRPDKPEHMVDLTRWGKDKKNQPIWKSRSHDSWVKQYNQAVKAIDEGVGRIMESLKETGQLDNTIVVFTSDQGFAWGQHGLRDKIAPYDASLLAPLIVSNPQRFPRGAVSQHPVNGADIIATFHTLTGLKPGIPLDGRDFSTLLKEPQRRDWNAEPMLQTYTGNFYGNAAITAALQQAKKTGNWEKLIVYEATGIRAWMLLREGKYKYIRYMYPDYIEELYDLETDPNELQNLAVRKEHHSLLAELRLKTVKGFAARGGSFVDLLPEPRLVSGR